MEQLEKRMVYFKQTSISLKKALEKFERLVPEDNYYDELRDSVIQRFKYSADTFWKLLKLFLETKYVFPPTATPKSILRIALDKGIINQQELNMFDSMVNDRNLTSHAYNPLLAEEIGLAIPNYYDAMKIVVERISAEIS